MVLPEPLSPTTPTVWPSRTVTLTPSTALTCPTVRRSSPRRIGNHTRTSSASITTGASARGARAIGRGSAASSRLVYGCWGASKIARVAPASTISPALITQTRSATLRTMPRSWVISSRAMPNLACRSRSSVRIWAWMVTSSAVVGSSAMSRSGSLARAMAIMTRWRWPPES